MNHFRNSVRGRRLRIVFESSDEVDELKHLDSVEYEEYRFAISWLSDEVLDIDRDLPEIPSILLEPPDQDSPMQILNKLNDFCLLTIFESAVLNIVDLAAISSTCIRFRNLAANVTRRKYNRIDCFNRELSGPLWRFEQVFEVCGELFEEVILNIDSDVECGMVGDYCPNVRTLKCYIEEQQTFNDLHTLPIQLEHLELHLCGNCSNLTHLPTHRLQQLRSLKVIGVDRLYPWLNVQLPRQKLSSLIEFHLVHARISYDELIFRQNPQLKKLLFRSTYCDISIRNILGVLPNLEALSIDDTDFVEIDWHPMRRYRMVRPIRVNP